MEPTITNLGDLESLLKSRLSEVSYLTVLERHKSGREEQLARIEVGDLPSWASPQTWTPEVDALLLRLRQELLGVAMGGHSAFRVAVYAPKGERLLVRTVTITDHQHPDTSAPSVEEVATEVEGRSLRQIGIAWEHYGHTIMQQMVQYSAMCLRQMNAVDEISRKQSQLTAQETAAARAQVNELVGLVTQAKMNEAEAKAALLTASADEAAEAKRTETGQILAKEAIGKLGELGQAFIISRTGFSPELSDIATSLQNHPAMVNALRDPIVREQLKNPDNLEYLANMLTQAAEIAQEQANAPAGDDSDDEPG